MEVAMLVIVLNVISLSLAAAFLGLSIVHAYNVESGRKSAVNVSAAGEWAFLVVCASVIAMRMHADVNWVDWTVSLTFLAAAAVHVRILRLIHRANQITDH